MLHVAGINFPLAFLSNKVYCVCVVTSYVFAVLWAFLSLIGFEGEGPSLAIICFAG